MRVGGVLFLFLKNSYVEKIRPQVLEKTRSYVMIQP